MHSCTGRVNELKLDPGGQIEARISCPAGALPAPGQYILARDPRETDAPLSTTVFPSKIVEDGFVAAAPVPTSWSPGYELFLSGPMGRGFHLPPEARRVTLAALGDSAARLLPLVPQALARDDSITIFSDAPLHALPASVEIYPLATLPEALSWADFLALDLPLKKLPELRLCLGLASDGLILCPVQALIAVPMPCAAFAECGACAVRSRRGWKLVCQDGPVFDLKELAW